MNLLDFLTRLFLAPLELSYGLIAAAVITLLTSGWLLAWFVAFFHAKYFRDWRRMLSTPSRLKVSWAWAWLIVAGVLLANLLQLMYRAEIPSLFAATPYLVAIGAALLIATVLRHGVRREVRVFQQSVQGGR